MRLDEPFRFPFSSVVFCALSLAFSSRSVLRSAFASSSSLLFLSFCFISANASALVKTRPVLWLVSFFFLSAAGSSGIWRSRMVVGSFGLVLVHVERGGG